MSMRKLDFYYMSPQAPQTNDEDNDKIDEEHPIDLKFPKDFGIKGPFPKDIGKVVWYIITIPALIPLYLTLPDVKNSEFTIMPSFKIPGDY